jgi:hypothetical protein
MKRIFIPLLVLLFCVPVCAQKTLRSSEWKKVQITKEDERLRMELKSDRSVLQISCGLFAPIDENIQYSQNRMRVQRENSRVRLLLYEASLGSDKKVRARMNCTGDAAAQTPYYMIVEQGKVKYMGDYIPDGKGGLLLDSFNCERLNIGTLTARELGGALEFTPLADRNYADKVLILQCQSGTKSFIF